MSDFDIDLEFLQIEITSDNEMNDQVFDIDIDMNMRDIARNAIEKIACHRFHF
jgi:hypothetical protein